MAQNHLEQQEDDKFKLYTEDIVEKPAVKYRRLIHFGQLICYAIIFGVVAATAFATVYPIAVRSLHKEPDNPSSKITIERDEYPSEDVTAESQPMETIDAAEPIVGVVNGSDPLQFADIYTSLQASMMNANKSIVSVYANKQSVDELFQTDDSEQPTAGVVIAEVDMEYIIMTQYSVVQDAKSISVQFMDGSNATGYFAKGDTDSDIALVRVKQTEVSEKMKSSMKIAQLGNSYKVTQGEIVIAVGRLSGNDFSVSYGTATNVSKGASKTDLYVGKIYTNLLVNEHDYGFLFDMEGSLVGIMNANAEEYGMVCYGISDLKGLIEGLSNGVQITYCGIVGRNVTSAISNEYHLPMGVYITSVSDESPAFSGGLQAGDVITEVNGEPVLTFSAFSEKIYKLSVNDTVIIKVKRLNKDEYRDIEFAITLGSRS